MALIPEVAAARSPRLRWVMAGVVAVVVTVDQVTKSLVLVARPSPGTGWAAIRLVRNTGIAGGFGAGYPLLVSMVVIAITGLAVTMALRARGRVTALMLAIVVGGALGNLADRLFRAPGLGRGAVVDWIHLGGGNGSMNVSDLAIQLGVIGAVIAGFAARDQRTARDQRAGQAGNGEPVRDKG
jgi:signal peptidase II